MITLPNGITYLKTCTKCRRGKPIEEFLKYIKSKLGNRTTERAICNECEGKKKKKISKKTQKTPRYKEYQKKYQEQMRKSDPAAYGELMKKYQRKYINELSDCYIRGLLRKSGHSKKSLEKNSEIIEDKRKELLVLRLKKHQKAIEISLVG